jgi:hypothetical protein
MKITLLTDLSGKIICAQHRPGNLADHGHISTQMNPSAEQQIHEIDIPAELSTHVLEGTLDREIFKYKVEGAGNRAKLVRTSAK